MNRNGIYLHEIGSVFMPRPDHQQCVYAPCDKDDNHDDGIFEDAEEKRQMKGVQRIW